MTPSATRFLLLRFCDFQRRRHDTKTPPNRSTTGQNFTNFLCIAIASSTVTEFIELRKRLNLTQTDLARYLGMSMRAIQDIENGRAELRTIHVLAIERVAMVIGAAVGDTTLVPANVMSHALDLAAVKAEDEAN